MCTSRLSQLNSTFILTAISLIIPLVHGFIECADAFQCTQENINTDILNSYGYKSSSNANISITTTSANCEGAFSCSDVSSLSSSATTNCKGGNSCSNINPLISDDFQCLGSNSCSSSTLIGATQNSHTYCSGYKSCANSLLLGIKAIDVSAAYALYNATIDSNYSGTLDMTLDGYHAALNARIICRFGDICNIPCAGNACYMLYVDCIGTCNISVTSSDTVYPITNISHLISPIVNLEYEPPQTSLDNDEICNEPKTITYDNNEERFRGDDILISNQTLCCRGCSSCREINIRHTNADKQRIVCSGYTSCLFSLDHSNIYTNGTVYCEGTSSCMWGKHYTTNTIYCLGRESCGYKTEIYYALDVFCFGFWSCAQSNIITSGLGKIHHVYYLGFLSGDIATYHCQTNDECIIYCGATDACDDLNVICDGICTVYCDADSKCPNGFNRNIKPTQSLTSPPTVIPTLPPSTQIPTLAPITAPTISPSSPTYPLVAHNVPTYSQYISSSLPVIETTQTTVSYSNNLPPNKQNKNSFMLNGAALVGIACGVCICVICIALFIYLLVRLYDKKTVGAQQTVNYIESRNVSDKEAKCQNVIGMQAVISSDNILSAPKMKASTEVVECKDSDEEMDNISSTESSHGLYNNDNNDGDIVTAGAGLENINDDTLNDNVSVSAADDDRAEELYEEQHNHNTANSHVSSTKSPVCINAHLVMRGSAMKTRGPTAKRKMIEHSDGNDGSANDAKLNKNETDLVEATYVTKS